ncbi:MAG: NAD(P)/FAD-dependent oxidoreductase [Halioglobus sp.]|nr:NAD(P)/FAD-dependent oxidoreductase [Halioglobus sp.]
MKIVIVGGGAGGLELATYLGNKLGRKGLADVVLIDQNQTHLWKPLLHEVAAGSLDAEVDSLSYRAHAATHGFVFKLGQFGGVDRVNRCIALAAVRDEEGFEVLPQRRESYDQLVIAIGSGCNDFNTPGVAEYAQFLDGPRQAEKFHKQLVNHFIQLNRKLMDEPTRTLSIVIVGGGATGVELSAELFNARQLFTLYGLGRVTQQHLKVTLLEAGPRLVPALAEHVSEAVRAELEKLGADIRLNTHVARAEKNAFVCANGDIVQADMMLWAAGVKVPDIIASIEGIETNRINQILVRPTLQSTTDDTIYAIGDCAGYALGDGRWVPPRAQSAHQMASLAGKNIVRGIRGKPLKDFKYRDHGSLVSLSQYTAIGVLMGNLGKGQSLNVRGWLARMVYISLYRMHQVALHGWFKASLLVVADRINHIVKPRLKLH